MRASRHAYISKDTTTQNFKIAAKNDPKHKLRSTKSRTKATQSTNWKPQLPTNPNKTRQ